MSAQCATRIIIAGRGFSIAAKATGGSTPSISDRSRSQIACNASAVGPPSIISVWGFLWTTSPSGRGAGRGRGGCGVGARGVLGRPADDIRLRTHPEYADPWRPVTQPSEFTTGFYPFTLPSIERTRRCSGSDKTQRILPCRRELQTAQSPLPLARLLPLCCRR